MKTDTVMIIRTILLRLSKTDFMTIATYILIEK